MIAYLQGSVKFIREQSLIVLCGGVGYEVFTPKPTLDKCKVGSNVELSIQTVIREDSWNLYGFHHSDLEKLFVLLTSVSGVGPKLALAMLSQLPSGVLAGAILDGDSKLLSSVSGVGKKTAERLVLELQNKIPPELKVAGSNPNTKKAQPLSNPAQDAIEALIALGFREAQVRMLIIELHTQNPETSTDAFIRQGLAKLR